MDILYKNNTVVEIAKRIAWNKKIKKWEFYNDEGLYLYAIDDGYKSHWYEGEIPADFTPDKYFFYPLDGDEEEIGGKFVLNPDWVEPPKPDAQRIAELEAMNEELEETMNDLLTNIIPELMMGMM